MLLRKAASELAKLIHLAEFDPLRWVRFLPKIAFTACMLLRKVANEFGEVDPPRRVRSMAFRRAASSFVTKKNIYLILPPACCFEK